MKYRKKNSKIQYLGYRQALQLIYYPPKPV